MTTLDEIEKRTTRMAAMLLQAGATIALEQPERFGFHTMTIHIFHTVGTPWGYQVYMLVPEDDRMRTKMLHEMTAMDTIRKAIETAQGSSIFDFINFVEPEE